MSHPSMEPPRRSRGSVLLLVGVLLLGALGPLRSGCTPGQEPASTLPFTDRGEQPGAAPEGAPEGAGEAAETLAPPTEVVVGVYVNQLRKVNIPENNFVIDFWIWFRWRKDSPYTINPLDTLEVVGGEITTKQATVPMDLGELNYAATRVVATVTHFYELERFPVEDHQISLIIEDTANEDHKVRFVSDTENSALDPKVHVPGFEILSGQPHLTTHVYATNYGDISLPSGSKSRYSRFEFRIHIQRPGYYYAVKLLWGLWLSTFVAFLALWIRPIDLDPRFGLGVGAIFTAMANQYLISEALPETSVVTRADWVGLLSISSVFLSIALSIVSLRYYQADRQELSRKIDIISFFSLAVVYTLLNALIVLV